MNRRLLLGGRLVSLAAPALVGGELQNCEPWVTAPLRAPRSPQRKVRVKPVMTNAVKSTCNEWEIAVDNL